MVPFHDTAPITPLEGVRIVLEAFRNCGCPYIISYLEMLVEARDAVESINALRDKWPTQSTIVEAVKSLNVPLENGTAQLEDLLLYGMFELFKSPYHENIKSIQFASGKLATKCLALTFLNCVLVADEDGAIQWLPGLNLKAMEAAYEEVHHYPPVRPGKYA
ncbi:hypothetical protein H0H81_000749 [Sphagnurus paluster]|uniref:Uncharacterized protein n=1 Tax=Sphagnurus paluster TaxID=117069 RepID=A0A9P7FTY9_9AGAR|nr:hypothetical protein H0H81_000749 [Sphagnurus paluster]